MNPSQQRLKILRHKHFLRPLKIPNSGIVSQYDKLIELGSEFNEIQLGRGHRITMSPAAHAQFSIYRFDRFDAR